MGELHVFKIRCGGAIEWVIAGDARDAFDTHCEWSECESDADPITQLDDAEPLPIRDDDGVGETRTCAEWAASFGRGLLCSTDY